MISFRIPSLINLALSWTTTEPEKFVYNTTCQWQIQGGSLGSAEPPYLSFCTHASPASCARTSAVENILDSGTPLS